MSGNVYKYGNNDDYYIHKDLTKIQKQSIWKRDLNTLP